MSFCTPFCTSFCAPFCIFFWILFCVGEEAEGEAVEGGGTEGGDGCAVVAGGVAFVDLPVVAGVLEGCFFHEFVAVGLGED